MKYKEKQRYSEMLNKVSDDIVNKNDPDFLNYDEIQKGDTFGILEIPKLNRGLPIVEGTDEEELSEGVGHFTNTGFPGQNKQNLLSGHRDTVFRDFGKLEVGDEFYIKTEKGTFEYIIDRFKIVSAEDTSVIDFNSNKEELVVSTCYPFSFIGSAPDRYIVYAYPKE